MSKYIRIKRTVKVVFRWFVAFAAVFFIAGSIIVVPYLIYESTHRDKVYSGVYLGDAGLAGYARDEVKGLINRRIDTFNQNGIVFRYRDSRAVLMPLVSSVSGDLAYRIIGFDAEATVDEIMAFGRENDFYDNLKQQIGALIYGRKFYMDYTVNEEELRNFLTDNFSRFTSPASDARLAYDHENGRFTVTEESIGQTLDYYRAILEFNRHLAALDDRPVYINDKTDLPRIYLTDCAGVETEAEKIKKLAPLTLAYGKNTWTLGAETLASWLTLKPKTAPDTAETKVTIGLDREAVTGFLSDRIAPEIDVKPVNAKLEIKNGRVIEFQASRDGLELNPEASLQNIEYELTASGNNRVELAVKELKSQIHTGDVNDLGIREIIGTGQSNFSGSPANRRHNISVGADTLDGLLIEPDEEFSLVGALGDIDKEAGYLPELVIKGNKTVPEYGGGLCQIGTTMFRAALASGLPVTMRQNHSYRVSYYEPAGTDATIYDPWPDLRFVNDTGNYILIQSRIEGDNIYFDFWGAGDGRIVEETDPVITNIVRPGPAELIETLDLPVGEKKCTELAHNGADASFDYKVTYADGDVKDKTFNSHYVPWRQVCLVGVDKLSTDTATSTKESTP